jgi:nicotinamidase-related amidase
METLKHFPIPGHYAPQQVGEVFRVEYESRAAEARAWAKTHAVRPAVEDNFRVNLFLVDVQNTFCIPGFELFVAGRSGHAAVEDNRRLCEFIYRNLGRITGFTLTLDTHKAIQIFHAIYLIDDEGNHPAPYTLISVEDVESGRWRFNAMAAEELGITPEVGQKNLVHYVKELAKTNRYALTIWPYHAMLGGIGHAVVPAVEEAVFFHSVARYSQADFEVKGTNPFTEHYSVVGPEVTEDAYGNKIGERNEKFIQDLQKYDVTLIAGQAKSHCVASTISHLLEDILAVEPSLAEKVYLLEDCTSPVVVPGMDYTEQADEAFTRFADAGMNLIKSTDAPEVWYRG